MNDTLIDKLSKLTLERNSLKRNIDRNYYNKKVRVRLFDRLFKVDNEIKKVKFMLRIRRNNDNKH